MEAAAAQELLCGGPVSAENRQSEEMEIPHKGLARGDEVVVLESGNV